MAYEYNVVVDGSDEGYTAYVDTADGPLRGHGSSPIAALRELVKTLADWQQGGSERWLNTPSGVSLARQFCPAFEPNGSGPAAA